MVYESLAGPYTVTGRQLQGTNCVRSLILVGAEQSPVSTAVEASQTDRLL